MILSSFLLKCKRVWMALRKPSKKELLQTAKIAGVGIILLGIIGFAISAVMKYIVR